MKIAVLGGTGRTGQHVVQRALAEGYEVVLLARTPEKLAIQDKKLTVLQGDVTDKPAVAKTVAGAEAVISSLTPTAVGMENIIAYLKDTGARRLIVTSGAGIDIPGDEPPFSGKIISWLIKTFSRQAYEESMAVADAVWGSGLDWTLARAPRLVDKPATGNLYVGPLNKDMKTTLSREDYANFLVTAVTDDTLINRAPVVSDK